MSETQYENSRQNDERRSFYINKVQYDDRTSITRRQRLNFGRHHYT